MPSELGVAGQERLDRGGSKARIHARQMPGREFDNSKVSGESFRLLVFSMTSVLGSTSHCPLLEYTMSRRSETVHLFLVTLAVSLGSVVALGDDQVLRPVVVLAAEVGLEDGLGAGGVALLGVERGTGHVGDGRVAALAEGAVGCPRSWPDLRASATSSLTTMAPRAVLTSQEPTLGLLVERAVDGDNVTLGEHLLEVLDTPAANFLLDLWGKGLVVEVQKLFAVEGLQTAQDTLTDTANGDGTDGLALEVVFVLGDLSDVPVASCNLLVSRHEVADEATVIPPLISLATFRSTWSEPIPAVTASLRFLAFLRRSSVSPLRNRWRELINQEQLTEGGHESVTLVLNPFPDTELPLISFVKKRYDSSEARLTSYKHRRTLPCREEVAVSSRELVGRARWRAERANTILKDREEWRVCGQERGLIEWNERNSLPQAEAWLSLPIPDLPFAVAVRGKTCLVPRKWSLVFEIDGAEWSSSFALSPYIGEEPEHTSVLDQFHDASASAPPVNGHSGDMLMMYPTKPLFACCFRDRKRRIPARLQACNGLTVELRKYCGNSCCRDAGCFAEVITCPLPSTQQGGSCDRPQPRAFHVRGFAHRESGESFIKLEPATTCSCRDARLARVERDLLLFPVLYMEPLQDHVRLALVVV
ncbi:Formate [Hortaea werneckii]|nr:Formate [Hortaea werneckii]